MRVVLVIAFIAVIALAAKNNHGECTEEDREKYEAIKKSKLDKISPEAKTAGKKIQDIYKANKDDSKAAHKEVHKLFKGLPESVREELKALKRRKSRAAHGGKKSLTEEEKEEFRARLEEKSDKLSEEAKAASKEIHKIVKEHKKDKKDTAAKKAIDKVLEGLSDSVRKELRALRTKNHKGPKRTTPKPKNKA